MIYILLLPILLLFLYALYDILIDAVVFFVVGDNDDNEYFEDIE